MTVENNLKQKLSANTQNVAGSAPTVIGKSIARYQEENECPKQPTSDILYQHHTVCQSISACNKYRLLQEYLHFRPLQADTDYRKMILSGLTVNRHIPYSY